MSTRSWFSVDGSLEPITFEGPSYFRYPLEVASFAVKNFSRPGSWILDPFCGFGTSLVAAQREGRHAVGFEKDPERGAFASQRVIAPSRVVLDDARNVARHDLPPFDLLFTGPPYTSLRDWSAESFSSYLDDFRDIFERLAARLRADAYVVVELSNVRSNDGVRTVLWDAGRILASIFRLEREIVRCNTGEQAAAPGYEHTTLLVLRARAS